MTPDRINLPPEPYSWVGAPAYHLGENPMDREPLITAATITALVSALVGLVVQFGVELTDGQQKAIFAVAAILAPLIVGFIARRKVTPTSQVRAQYDSEDNLVDPRDGRAVAVTKIS